MKKIYAFLFTLLLASGAAAQNPTAYFMEGSTLRSQFNPAFAPLRGYVNIPGLGGLDINVSGNLSIDKILYPRNGKLVTLLDSSVSTADALSGLKADNLLGLDTRVNLIGFGAFTRNHKNFWSFDLNARVTTDATLPYSLFDFLKRGNSGDISDIGITADSYLEAGFNYSFPLLDDKLYIGVRAKFLMGVARARMYFTQFNVSHNEERWLINAAGGLDITAAGLDVKTELNDHGEEVYDYRDFFCRSHDLPLTPEVCKYQFEIPFMIWMSDTYRRNRPDVAAQVAGALDRPFSADDLSHLLLDLAGIRCRWYDPARSLIGERFAPTRPRPLLMGFEPAGNYETIIGRDRKQ